ncbi:MAG: hypothetical protein ABJA62_11485 [Luteimonas sp.]
MPTSFLNLPHEQQAALEAAYATPPRAYHNFGHVQEVLHHFHAIADGPGWAQPRAVQLAVLYHDAIYEAGRSDNEERSADLAVEHMARWLPQEAAATQRVAELIRLTARHGQFVPTDFGDDAASCDTRHFLDCDMAILGARPAQFDAYDRGITAEYRGTVPAWLFKLNRRRFLKNLLTRERIFLSEWFHARYDAPARANLRRAVTTKR